MEEKREKVALNTYLTGNKGLMSSNPASSMGPAVPTVSQPELFAILAMSRRRAETSCMIGAPSKWFASTSSANSSRDSAASWSLPLLSDVSTFDSRVSLEDVVGNAGDTKMVRIKCITSRR